MVFFRRIAQPNRCIAVLLSCRLSMIVSSLQLQRQHHQGTTTSSAYIRIELGYHDDINKRVWEFRPKFVCTTAIKRHFVWRKKKTRINKQRRKDGWKEDKRQNNKTCFSINEAEHTCFTRKFLNGSNQNNSLFIYSSCWAAAIDLECSFL